jgi:hypothetical protein
MNDKGQIVGDSYEIKNTNGRRDDGGVTLRRRENGSMDVFRTQILRGWPNAPRSTSVAINNSGDVLLSETPTGGQSYGNGDALTLWDMNGGRTELISRVRGDYEYILNVGLGDLNNKGEVVGSWSDLYRNYLPGDYNDFQQVEGIRTCALWSTHG